MTEDMQKQLGSTLWKIADDLRGAMDADDFRDYMLSFLFLRYLSDNYEAAAKKELKKDYPKLKEDDKRTPLSVWYQENEDDTSAFEKQMRRKVHYVIRPEYLWSTIYELARIQSDDLLKTLGSSMLRMIPLKVLFKGCFLKSIWTLKNLVKTILTVMPNYVRLLQRLPKDLRSFLPKVIFWAMPMNI